jgi:hypothetical protein
VLEVKDGHGLSGRLVRGQDTNHLLLASRATARRLVTPPIGRSDSRNRPEGDLQFRHDERSESAKKRTLAEGVGCASPSSSGAYRWAVEGKSNNLGRWSFHHAAGSGRPAQAMSNRAACQPAMR